MSGPGGEPRRGRDPASAGSTAAGPPEVGSVFVSNYPPYSLWSRDDVPAAREALASPARPNTTLGLYVHIPFCRLRCKFCYFKVYTDQESAQVRRYLDGVAAEARLLAPLPSVKGRGLRFIYFGGGTPSFVSSSDTRKLAERLQAAIPWDGAAEITFECEPGTLTRSKLETIRGIGVTRLSLGVESFDDAILEENGRAHRSAEIRRCLPWIRALHFPQLNIDLIAGMVGESWETWRESVRRTIETGPESVTIYQMELPYNTVYTREVLEGRLGQPLAGWEEKRAWQDYAFEQLAAAGYEISSAYTMVKQGAQAAFVYRDAVWHGTDMLGTGVASFSHMSGVHYQNLADQVPYLETVRRGDLPLDRAFRTRSNDLLTREVILQLKLGRLEAGYFQGKFGQDILERFGTVFRTLEEEGMAAREEGGIRLTRRGLLRVDSLLPAFYAPEHRTERYT